MYNKKNAYTHINTIISAVTENIDSQQQRKFLILNPQCAGFTGTDLVGIFVIQKQVWCFDVGVHILVLVNELQSVQLNRKDEEMMRAAWTWISVVWTRISFTSSHSLQWWITGWFGSPQRPLTFKFLFGCWLARSPSYSSKIFLLEFSSSILRILIFRFWSEFQAGNFSVSVFCVLHVASNDP